jgi:NADH-quinone oxidoreductase subunit G
MADAPASGAVTIVLDGREVTAARGEMIIAAAERAGVYIPRFCYHPRMKPVGMCRMCLVDLKGPRGFALTPACFVAVSDGQEIVTDSPAVRKAQDGVLEFLLVNHPLDCPVCDKGGECPLQDQTFAFGPGETRFVEEKRHWEKPIALSRLVLLDRERCIQCARCTRFSDEIAGDPLIDFAKRGDQIEVATFPAEPFASYFSGNTVQICPVGALTSVPYRFRARPWDLEQVESSCTSCAVGCRVAVQSSADRITRYLGIDSDPVNQSWMCDKGRFDFEAVNSGERLSAPLIRRGDELVEVSWSEALAAVGTGLGDVIRVRGGSSTGVIGGARLANEDAFAWSKLARTVLGTDNVDAQLGDGLDPELVVGLPRATIDQACRASAVVLLGPDLKEELPVLYLRLRRAALEDRVPIVELAVRRSGLSPYAASTLLYRPGEAAVLAEALVAGADPADEVAGVPAADVAAARRVLAGARQPVADGNGDPGRGGRDAGVVVVLGRPSLADSGSSVAEAAAVLAAEPGVRFLSALRRSNIHGALDMGLAPGLLPGRVSLDAGRAWYEEGWGATLPAARGLDTGQMLAAASEGRLGALVLLGADPIADFPDPTLAGRGLGGVGFVVAVDCFLTESSRRADVVLPVATYAERPGTFTNQEGRVNRLGQKVTAPGVAWPDWMVAAEVAAALGADLGFTSLESIWAEVERLSPAHHGLTAGLLARPSSGDGVLVPLGARPGIEPGTGRPGGGPAAREIGTDAGAGLDQAPPAPIDPMSDPGIGSVEMHGVPATSLAAAEPAMGERLGGPGDTGPARAAGQGVQTGEAGGPGEGGEAWSAAPPRPPLLSWLGTGQVSEVPRRDSYSLRLIATRCLWDAGTLVQQSPHLAGLHPRQRLAVNQYDLDRLGVASGGRVRAISPRASLVLDVEADAGVARGTAAIVFNLPGDGAAELIDATGPVTDIRLETV